ncbi:MAG: branched-chain amino acid ABC transporter permease [Chloroflexi bacterium]|nr:MAG: branched-chain amino acid ABC transporter permease [Chloroflexota bacterium]
MAERTAESVRSGGRLQARRLTWIRLVLIVTALAVVVALLWIPTRPNVTLAFWFTLLKFLILAQSMNIIAGYAGYVDFGHVAFFGLGTYAAGIMLWRFHLDRLVVISPVVAGVATALIAAVVGLPVLRLRGAYFAIAMLSFNESMRVLMLNVPRSIAGGVYGIPYPRIHNPTAAYYGIVSLAVLITAGTYFLATSRFGVALKAIREDEDAASVMGINTTRYKVAAFAISAFFAGAVGGLDFWFTAYTSPELVFNTPMTVEMLAMMMFGGAGTTLGPVIGATSLYVLRDKLWYNYPFIYLIIFGGILAAVVLVMPRGVLGLIEDRIPALRAKIK